jgi:hypothetical protein
MDGNIKNISATEKSFIKNMIITLGKCINLKIAKNIKWIIQNVQVME